MAKHTDQPGIRATLYELWNRYTNFDKDEKVYYNGRQNMYPNEIDLVISNSPTASRCAEVLAKYIAGAGISGIEDVICNKKKRLRLSDLIRLIADDVSVQNGCYIHVSYGISDNGDEIIPKSFDVMPYAGCRIMKQDDEGNNGMVKYKDWEDKNETRFKSVVTNEDRPSKAYYPYNRDKAVLIKQIIADSGDEELELAEQIKKFRGQVFYLNLTPRYRYAVSKFDSVYNDCDTEYRMGVYSNMMIRGGFMGKLAVVTQNLDAEQATQVGEDLQAWLGAEEANKLYHLDLVEEVDNLDDVLKIIKVESQYDDDMFTETAKRCKTNIMGAANNMPKGLIDSNDGALFGPSDGAYDDMKLFLSEQTSEERTIIENLMHEFGFKGLEIKPLAYVDSANDSENTAGSADGEPSGQEGSGDSDEGSDQV